VKKAAAKTRGGARPGAGRPPEANTRTAAICGRVTEQEKEWFQALGGMDWLRPLIAKAGAKL
jgi:hypothetical protein